MTRFDALVRFVKVAMLVVLAAACAASGDNEAANEGFSKVFVRHECTGDSAVLEEFVPSPTPLLDGGGVRAAPCSDVGVRIFFRRIDYGLFRVIPVKRRSSFSASMELNMLNSFQSLVGADRP